MDASIIQINQMPPPKEAVEEEDEEMQIPEESKVGKKLSDLTTRRVILLVLAMLFSVPVFTVSTYVSDYNGYKVGLQLMSEYVPHSPGFNDAFESFIVEGAALDNPLILVSAANISWQTDINPDTLRTDEKEIVSYKEEETGYSYVAIYDLTKNVELQAALGIATTLFVCVVLATGALIFSNLATELVIGPIEQMI